MTRHCLGAILACLLLVVLAGPALAQNLLTNGDFEDSLAFWSVTYDSAAGTWGVTTDSGYHPDPDNEVYVYKTYKYYTRAYQTVDVPSTQLRFTASAKFYTLVGTGASYYAYATVALEYRNSAGDLLGRTMFIKKTPNCNLRNTPTQHLVVITSTDWQDYELWVDEELESLPGINPADVAKVSVVLEAYGNGSPG